MISLAKAILCEKRTGLSDFKADQGRITATNGLELHNISPLIIVL